MFDKYLDKFMPSKEMAEYLKTQEDTMRHIVDIIYFSPCPVQDKLVALKELEPRINRSGDAYLIEECHNYIRSIETALNLLKAEGIFTLEVIDYDEKTTDNDFTFEGAFAEFDHVMEYVQQLMEYNKQDGGELCCYEVVKWIKGNDGNLFEACTYILADGEIFFVEPDDKILGGYICGFYGCGELNLPVPYKSGEIVEIDGYPFTPKVRVLIASIGDNHDCCCLQGIHKMAIGNWGCAAIKHNWIGFKAFPQISPLYTMKIYKGELPEDEKILEEVQEYIREHQDLAEDFIFGFGKQDGLTEKELRKMMVN